MKKINYRLLITFLSLHIYLGVLSCTGGEKLNRVEDVNSCSGQYTVYIINYSFHTGIVIPVNSDSIPIIHALKPFNNSVFTDIGWGEEKFYQDPSENFCMGARAILLPNTSVIRMEGYNSIDGMISWSDFTVKLTLTCGQFIKLCNFIENSFKKDNDNKLIITSEKHSGDTIFFKSVYRYYLFNTCNTWVAKALDNAGLGVSPFFILTEGQLYNEIKDHGTVLKKP